MDVLSHTALMKRPGSVINARIVDLKKDIEELREALSVLSVDTFVVKEATAAHRILREKLDALEEELRKANNIFYIDTAELEKFLSGFYLVPIDSRHARGFNETMQRCWITNGRDL